MFESLTVPAPGSSTSVEDVLRRRGHLMRSKGDIRSTLYPEDDLVNVLFKLGQFDFVKYFSNSPMPVYLSHFGRSSFRKLVRALLRDGRTPKTRDSLRAVAGNALDEHLELLAHLQLIEVGETDIRLRREVDNLGPSLEHYVAMLCRYELSGSSEWGVTLDGLPRAGGDYDVLAWLDPSLVYVECKSAPPGEISESEVREFLQRTLELAPDIAIMLVDTQDDLTPLADSKFNPILSEARGDGEVSRYVRELEDYRGVFHAWGRIYLTGSKKTILEQIRRCIQHYYVVTKSPSFGGQKHLAPFSRHPLRDER